MKQFKMSFQDKRGWMVFTMSLMLGAALIGCQATPTPSPSAEGGSPGASTAGQVAQVSEATGQTAQPQQQPTVTATGSGEQAASNPAAAPTPAPAPAPAPAPTPAPAPASETAPAVTPASGIEILNRSPRGEHISANFYEIQTTALDYAISGHLEYQGRPGILFAKVGTARGKGFDTAYLIKVKLSEGRVLENRSTRGGAPLSDAAAVEIARTLAQQLQVG